jgi:Mlc titration factor MtfA (ptsG expression regulator)
VVHEHAQVLRGESSSLGQVVLSWSDVVAPVGLGHNLVVHTFARQLDQAKGAANGAPFTFASQAQRQRWAAVMTREFEQRTEGMHSLENRRCSRTTAPPAQRSSSRSALKCSSNFRRR